MKIYQLNISKKDKDRVICRCFSRQKTAEKICQEYSETLESGEWLSLVELEVNVEHEFKFSKGIFYKGGRPK